MSISGMVNQEEVAMIVEMGFTKIVAEKALFMNQGNGGGVPKAMEWIEQHQEDPDFEEELVIVTEAGEPKPVSTLSVEERIQKAKEL
jgi:uncharacterized UBP type Zn finger protein